MSDFGLGYWRRDARGRKLHQSCWNSCTIHTHHTQHTASHTASMAHGSWNKRASALGSQKPSWCLSSCRTDRKTWSCNTITVWWILTSMLRFETTPPTHYCLLDNSEVFYSTEMGKYDITPAEWRRSWKRTGFWCETGTRWRLARDPTHSWSVHSGTRRHLLSSPASPAPAVRLRTCSTPAKRHRSMLHDRYNAPWIFVIATMTVEHITHLRSIQHLHLSLHHVRLTWCGQWSFIPLTSTLPHLRCDVGLEEGERKLSLSCSIVYYYNGAQRYEQFLQVGQLYRALILLSLALFQAPLFLQSSWCYTRINFFLLTSFSLPLSELSLVRLALDVVD